MFILKVVGVALVAGIVGYGLGFGLGMMAVNTFSNNTHDKGMESAMTGAFFVGPVVAILGAIAGAGLYWYFAKG